MRPEMGVSLDLAVHDTAKLSRAVALLRQIGVVNVRVPIRMADAARPNVETWYRRLFSMLRDYDVLPVVIPPSLAEAKRLSGGSDVRNVMAAFVERLLAVRGSAFDTVQFGHELDPRALPLAELASRPRGDEPAIVTAAMLHRAAGLAQKHNKRTVLAGLRPICPRWLEVLRDMGGLSQFDVVAAHAFPHAGPTWADGATFCSMLHLQRRLGTVTNRPVWVTAAGHPGDRPGVEPFMEDAAWAPLERVYWHLEALPSAAALPPDLACLRRLIAEKRRVEVHQEEPVAT